MSALVAEVVEVERDSTMRAWEITLNVSSDGVSGQYQFCIPFTKWGQAQSNRGQAQRQGDNGAYLLIEKEGAQ